MYLGSHIYWLLSTPLTIVFPLLSVSFSGYTSSQNKRLKTRSGQIYGSSLPLLFLIWMYLGSHIYWLLFLPLTIVFPLLFVSFFQAPPRLKTGFGQIYGFNTSATPVILLTLRSMALHLPRGRLMVSSTSSTAGHDALADRNTSLWLKHHFGGRMDEAKKECGVGGGETSFVCVKVSPGSNVRCVASWRFAWSMGVFFCRWISKEQTGNMLSSLGRRMIVTGATHQPAACCFATSQKQHRQVCIFVSCCFCKHRALLSCSLLCVA